MHLLAERFVFWGDDGRGFSKRGSKALSAWHQALWNGTKVAVQLLNFFFRLHIYTFFFFIEARGEVRCELVRPIHIMIV